MKGPAPIYSCSEKCGVKGRKTVVDNMDKLEEASTGTLVDYVRTTAALPL